MLLHLFEKSCADATISVSFVHSYLSGAAKFSGEDQVADTSTAEKCTNDLFDFLVIFCVFSHVMKRLQRWDQTFFFSSQNFWNVVIIASCAVVGEPVIWDAVFLSFFGIRPLMMS